MFWKTWKEMQLPARPTRDTSALTQLTTNENSRHESSLSQHTNSSSVLFMPSYCCREVFEVFDVFEVFVLFVLIVLFVLFVLFVVFVVLGVFVSITASYNMLASTRPA